MYMPNLVHFAKTIVTDEMPEIEVNLRLKRNLSQTLYLAHLVYFF